MLFKFLQLFRNLFHSKVKDYANTVTIDEAKQKVLNRIKME